MPTQDLTHALEPGTWTYPGDPPISVESHATIAADGYRVSALSLGTHAGTHLDAPSHTEPEGATVAELPVEGFAFEAALVDLEVGAGASIGPDSLSTVPDDADLLVLDTGWATHWGTDRYVDHPYLTPEAATWCAQRGLSVAVDAPSVDPSVPAVEPTPTGAAGGDHDDTDDELPAHRAILGAGLVVLENLTALADLPARFELRAYPLPIGGGDGSPVRAVAVF